LDNDFVHKEKTPVFTGPLEKIRDHWDAFVTYKTSKRAKIRSATNKNNAANKKYFNILGQGGYNAGIPKWKKMEDELIRKGIIPRDIEMVSMYHILQLHINHCEPRTTLFTQDGR
jgi:hypothetical protein